MEHHRVEERRGLMGTIVARYGGEDYVAVDVRLVGGQYRLFWPRDLGGDLPLLPAGLVALAGRLGLCGLTQALYSPKCVEGEFCEVHIQDPA